MNKPFAYSKALAGESVPSRLNELWDENLHTYEHVSHDDLERYARTVAYKVAFNLKNGLKMNPRSDPLTYIDCGGTQEDN